MHIPVLHQSDYIVCGSGYLQWNFWFWEFYDKILHHKDYHSNDDVSALSGPDSDISETVEKADFVEFLDNDSSTTLAGSEADLDT